MPSPAAFPSMLKRGREHHGLRIARAAWVCGVSVQEYRALESGDTLPSADTYERIVTSFGWPVSYWPGKHL